LSSAKRLWTGLSRPLYAQGVTLVLFAVAFISIGTYFSALSQYPTADQNNTFNRLHLFLADISTADIINGSSFSNLVVAFPGQAIATVLNAFFNINDRIVGNINYTAYLPFAIVQVVVALALISFLSMLVARLAWPAKPRLNATMFTLIVIMNFPMLKAMCKVLKYDALSTLLSAIAVVLYIGYHQFNRLSPALFGGRFCVFLIAIVSAFAYIEKDTTVFVAFMIVLIELLLTPLSSANLRSGLLSASRFVAAFALTFVATMLVFVPKVLLAPSEIPKLFGNVTTYIVNVPVSIMPAALFVVILAYAAGPLLRRRLALDRNLIGIIAASLSASAFAVVALAFAALIFQDNILYDPTIAGNDLDAAKLRALSIYVPRLNAGAAITTLDQSAWLQHLKIFFSMVRAIFYTLPETSVLMVVAAAPLFLALANKSRALLETHGIASVALLVFPAAMLAAYSLGDMPFAPNYLVLASLLLTVYGLFPVLIGLARINEAGALGIQTAIAILVVALTLPADPSYLRYKNIFRDRDRENAAAIDMNHYIWWTWPGWGETAYPIGKFVEKHHDGPITIAYDYLPPFYTAAGLKWVSVDYSGCVTQGDLKARLAKVQSQSADYLIVSKNMSNRNWCENQILRRMRTAAVYVDIQQGFEYGWLFRVSDTIAAFRD